MNYRPEQRRFGWLSIVAIVATAIFLLPMAPGSSITPAQTAVADQPESKEKPAKRTDYPTIVKSVPEMGATNISTDLKEIQVTFDRKMQTGMSWTGGPPLFPPTDTNRKARWLNDRTCVLPVQLEAGAFYRLGLNSKSYLNFKSSDGTPVPPTSLFFVTTGATKEVAERVRVPKVVTFEPANGGDKVDPSIKQISVTFDIPMGDGMSWTGGGETFPNLPPGQSASWSPDKLTCTLPVKLEPNHEYRLGINSLQHNNFQTEWGIEVVPVEYRFKTSQ